MFHVEELRGECWYVRILKLHIIVVQIHCQCPLSVIT